MAYEPTPEYRDEDFSPFVHQMADVMGLSVREWALRTNNILKLLSTNKLSKSQLGMFSAYMEHKEAPLMVAHCWEKSLFADLKEGLYSPRDYTMIINIAAKFAEVGHRYNRTLKGTLVDQAQAALTGYPSSAYEQARLALGVHMLEDCMENLRYREALKIAAQTVRIIHQTRDLNGQGIPTLENLREEIPFITPAANDKISDYYTDTYKLYCAAVPARRSIDDASGYLDAGFLLEQRIYGEARHVGAQKADGLIRKFIPENALGVINTTVYETPVNLIIDPNIPTGFFTKALKASLVSESKREEKLSRIDSIIAGLDKIGYGYPAWLVRLENKLAKEDKPTIGAVAAPDKVDSTATPKASASLGEGKNTPNATPTKGIATPKDTPPDVK